MLSNRASAEIAKFSAKPITERLKFTAYEQVVENFCRRHCGKTPDGELCFLAAEMHRQLLWSLFQSYSREN